MPYRFITFKSDKAFNYLIANGYVYTIRKRLAVGNKWLKRDWRGDPIGLVRVEPVGVVKAVGKGKYAVNVNDELIPLEQFVKYSGFDSLEEWISFEKLHAGCIAGSVLYKVVLVKLL